MRALAHLCGIPSVFLFLFGIPLPKMHPLAWCCLCSALCTCPLPTPRPQEVGLTFLLLRVTVLPGPTLHPPGLVLVRLLTHSPPAHVPLPFPQRTLPGAAPEGMLLGPKLAGYPLAARWGCWQPVLSSGPVLLGHAHHGGMGLLVALLVLVSSHRAFLGPVSGGLESDRSVIPGFCVFLSPTSYLWFPWGRLVVLA